MADVRIDWHDREAALFLDDIEGYLMPSIAWEVQLMAESIAPVRVRRTGVPRWAKRGYVGRPGRLKASTVWWETHDSYGRVWRVGALWYGRFMDPKARQLHRLRPFLVTSLRTIVDGRVWHLHR